MHIAILGRQPALGMAELEHLYGNTRVHWASRQSALIDVDSLPLERLGGTLKAGRIVAELPQGDWRQASMKLVQAYLQAWSSFDGKLTLGISAYGFDVSARDVQKTGIILKQKLKKSGISLRLIPNAEATLNTATSHHNKLGLSNNKVELIVVKATNGHIFIAESIGAQNITAYTRRDQERPKRDAFVGMLPPKLAQIMINLTSPLSAYSNIASDSHVVHIRSNGVRSSETSLSKPHSRLLDPFCGTGVVLQEAALMGFSVYGTDLSEKMIAYSKENLSWLERTHHLNFDARLHEGDAMTTAWQPPIDTVVCESYLGQPFSAPPSPAKLDQVRGNCDHIITTFLKNIGSQIAPGTPLCIAIPAWRSIDGHFTHLPLIQKLEALGFTRYSFKNITNDELLYFREDQVVARELLVIVKA